MELTDKWCIRGGDEFRNYISGIERKKRKNANITGHKSEWYYWLDDVSNIFYWNHSEAILFEHTLISFEEFLQLINKEGHQNNNNYQIY